MRSYRRSIVIEAPFAEVWKFHSTVDGLHALTPDWVGLTVDRVRLPTGATGDELVEGAEIDLRTRPFGIVPGGHWTSRITARSRNEDEGMFRDETCEGPFDEWVHTHRFVELEFGTLVHDRVEYSFGIPGSSVAVRPALAALFAYRHARTRSLLE